MQENTRRWLRRAGFFCITFPLLLFSISINIFLNFSAWCGHCSGRATPHPPRVPPAPRGCRCLAKPHIPPPREHRIPTPPGGCRPGLLRGLGDGRGLGEPEPGNRSRGPSTSPPPGPEDAAPSPPRGPSSYRAATRGPPGSVCGRSCACPGLGEPGGGLRCLRSAPGTRPASPHLRHRDPPGAPPSGLPSGGS